jgi:hypothetical protein
MSNEEPCGSECKAKKALNRTLASARNFPRDKVPKGKEAVHQNLMASVIIERADRRCKGLNCSLSAAVIRETTKANEISGELWVSDLAPVAALVMKKLENKAKDATQQTNVMQDKVAAAKRRFT